MRHAAIPLGLLLGAAIGWWLGYPYWGVLIGLVAGLLGSDLASRPRRGTRA